MALPVQLTEHREWLSLKGHSCLSSCWFHLSLGQAYYTTPWFSRWPEVTLHDTTVLFLRIHLFRQQLIYSHRSDSPPSAESSVFCRNYLRKNTLNYFLLSFLILTWRYVYWFERERNIDLREKHQLDACHTCPDWGSNTQSRYVPWLGIEPTNFGVWDNAPTNWTTGQWWITF